MKICILGGNVKRALKGEYVGGAEKQVALIARGLVALNHEVCVMESFSGREFKEEVGGVQVIQTWDRAKGIPGIRSLFYRLPLIYIKIRQEKPDIIYSRSVGIYSAMIAFLFQRSKVKFVWGLAHDQDLQPEIRKTNKTSLYSTISNKLMFNLASKILVKHSKMIICQTEEQVAYLVSRKMENKVALIPNICESSVPRELSANNTHNCIWVGKFSGTKGELDFLRLAQKMPSIKFIAVGHVTSEFKKTAIYSEILKQANIECVGRLKHRVLLELLKEVDLLVHTAPSEGFSNVFLEAWSCGVPVVSLHVDPSALLKEKGLGSFASGNVEKMSGQIEELINSPSMRKSIGCRAIQYIQKNHAPSIIIKKIDNLFINLLALTE